MNQQIFTNFYVNSKGVYNKLLEQEALVSLLELKQELPFITKSRLYLLNKSINSLKKYSLLSKHITQEQKKRIKSSVFNIIKRKNKNEIIYCIKQLRHYKMNINQSNCIEGLINLLKTQLN